MVDAIKKELEEAENEEAAKSEPEVQEDEEAQEASSEETDEPKEQEVDEEEKERLAKQDAYRERKRKEKEGVQHKARDHKVSDDTKKQELPDDEMDVLKRTVAQYGEVVKEYRYESNIKQAEKELIDLEKPFKEAFPDYDDKVNQAIELTKLRLLEDGADESYANDYLKREKVLLADRAAARGEDPVEAVYKEAEKILNVFEAYAEKNGYTKGRPKTKMQALKEMSKPNAMTAGAGRGASAAKQTFDELGDDDLEEIHNTTIWDVK